MPQNASKNITSEQTSYEILIVDQENPSCRADDNNITAITSRSDIYIIKEYHGHIGVFLNDEAQPYKEVNISVSNLPAQDQDSA